MTVGFFHTWWLRWNPLGWLHLLAFHHLSVELQPSPVPDLFRGHWFNISWIILRHSGGLRFFTLIPLTCHSSATQTSTGCPPPSPPKRKTQGWNFPAFPDSFSPVLCLNGKGPLPRSPPCLYSSPERTKGFMFYSESSSLSCLQTMNYSFTDYITKSIF